MMAAALQDLELPAPGTAPPDRRTHRRLSPRELAWIREVRLKSGPRVSLIDLSSGGALLHTDVPLRPGADLVIEIIGPSVEAVPFRVLRSELVQIAGGGAVYRGACEFKRPLDLARPATGGRQRGDLALKRILARRREGLDIAAGARTRRSDRELLDLLRAVQRSVSPEDPLSRGLRDLLAEVIPALDGGAAGAVLRASLEERLRHALPGLAVAIGSAPLRARSDMETIYFASPGPRPSGVINVEMPEGTGMPDWQFHLLQAGSYLLELLPAGDLSDDLSPSSFVSVQDQGVAAEEPPLPQTPLTPGWQKIVVRYREGRLLKGFTHDFHASRTQFSLWPSVNAAPSERMYVPTSQLKAVFFVKDFAGNPDHHEQPTFDAQVGGRRIEVTFADDEVLLGSTLGYRPDGVGFFVTPADARGNNVRVFVVSGAIRHVRFL